MAGSLHDRSAQFHGAPDRPVPLSYVPTGLEADRSPNLAIMALIVSLLPPATFGGMAFLWWRQAWAYTPLLVTWVVLWIFLVAPAVAVVLAVMSFLKPPRSRWAAVVAIVVSTLAFGSIVVDAFHIR